MHYSLDGVRIETAGEDYWIAPTAAVIGRIRLERNASVWWGAVLRGDHDLITVGEDSNVQDCSVLHTDHGFPLTIGAGVTIGHMVMLHGCTIGDGSLIGIGAVILNGTRIGRNCLIGAKTLLGLGKDIPDNSVVMGAPGKVIKQVTPEMTAHIAEGVQTYVANWRRYKAGLIAEG